MDKINKQLIALVDRVEKFVSNEGICGDVTGYNDLCKEEECSYCDMVRALQAYLDS